MNDNGQDSPQANTYPRTTTFHDDRRRGSAPIISLDKISRNFGLVKVLAPLDLTIDSGRILGLLGPNGAGKTTLLSIMACTLAPSSGTVTIGGITVTDTASARRARRHVSLMPQHPGAIPSFSALDTVEYSSWIHEIPRKGRREACREALDRVGLSSQADKPMRKLSGGMIQRTHLAAALVSRPSLLLLDEPTVGLDPAQRIAFRELIEDLPNTATILATHLVEDVRAVSDELMVMDSGRIRFRGTTDELEERARPDAPGDSGLERGYMTVLEEMQ